MAGEPPRLVRWVGSVLDDLRAFPEEPRTAVGYAIWLAQTGSKAPAAKPMKGIVKGAGVLEVVEQHDGNTYRAVYTLRFEGVVYVLHAFQKKSRKGLKTPKHEVDLIRRRYRAAEEDFRRREQV